MKKLFFPYLLAGYPDPSRFAEILDLTLQYADTIEIGIPFSDPVADGPLIATAASQVLQRAFELDSVFRLLQSKKAQVPIALMSYANPILSYGTNEFLKAAAQCGIPYLIIPDVPFEESAQWRTAAKQNGVDWISFISPATSDQRLQQIAKSSEGFIYLLGLKGITGANIGDAENILSQARKIRQCTNTPIALGFGVKSVEDTIPFRDGIDAFIVGSKIIELINQNSLKDLEEFYRTFLRPSTC